MTEYEALKVAELKEQLRERGLTVSGKKAELIARLQEHDEQQVQYAACRAASVLVSQLAVLSWLDRCSRADQLLAR